VSTAIVEVEVVPVEVITAAAEEDDTLVITIGVYPVAETTPFVTMLVYALAVEGASSALPEDVETETYTSRIGAPRFIVLVAKAAVCLSWIAANLVVSLSGSVIS